VNSSEIKTKLLHYWRFTRNGYDYLATEVGKFNSDVLVSNGKEIIECEVKCSRADLRNDFKKTARSGTLKHSVYKKPSTYYSQWLPNRFYFAVGKELGEYALEMVSGTPYGVIEVSSNPFSNRKRDSYCLIVKKAGIIQPIFRKKLYRQIIMRESSELIRLRIKLGQ